MKIRPSLPTAAGAALIAGALALSACGSREPGPAAKAFNARERQSAKEREASLHPRIVRQVKAVNGGYQTMPSEMSAKGVVVPDDHARATGTAGAASAAGEVGEVPPAGYAPAPRIRPPRPFPMLDAGAPGGRPLTTPGPDARPPEGPVAPGTPATVAKPDPRRAAAIAKAVAEAETRRKAVQRRQEDAIRKQSERRLATLRRRDAARDGRFRFGRPTDVAPAKGTITTAPKPASSKPAAPKAADGRAPGRGAAAKATPKGG